MNREGRKREGTDLGIEIERANEKRGGTIRVRGRGRHRERQTEKDSDKVEVKEYNSLLNLKFIQS